MALLVVAAGTIPVSVADAQADPARLTLVEQDAWSVLGGTLEARIRVQGTREPGLSVSVVAHQAVTSRSGFERTTGDAGLGSVLSQLTVPLDNLPGDASGSRQLSIGLQSPDGPRDPTRLAVRRAGVYPVAFELRDPDDRSLSRFVSYLVAVPADASGGPEALPTRLGVAWVWPLLAAPALLPDGQPDPSVTAAMQATGRLGRQAAALTDATAVPLTLVPGPETLAAWSTFARADPALDGGIRSLRLALAGHQVVSSPYVPIDIPSLLASALGSAVDAEIVQGDETLKQLYPAPVDTRTALARPVDDDTLARLRARGVDHMIVDGSALGTVEARLTPARPFALEAPPSLIPGGTVQAVAGDDAMEALLTGSGPAALRAQRYLAALALVALEQPNARRAIVVVNPSDFDPGRSLLTAVLTGLRAHPWLEPMTVADVFARVPAETGNGATRELAPINPAAPPVRAADYSRAQRQLDAFRSLVEPTDPRLARGEDALLASLSAIPPGAAGAARGRAELGAVEAGINDFLARIQVPTPSTITLTSRSGEIPLTFRNGTGQRVRVRIRLDSQKLFFPDGSARNLDLAPRSTTVRVAVEARTSGTFPMRLTVSSVDGRLPITETGFRIRSTFVSTVGIGLTVGAAVFLAGWWIWDFRRRRHARRTAANPA